MENYDEVLDLLSRLGGLGSNASSIYEQIRGINTLGTHTGMPLQRKQSGMTFFTRPRLNLSRPNLMAWRPFSVMMANNNTRTLPWAVRCMLDPKGVWARGEESILVDNQQAFIPWLTNGLLSQSGWTDIMPGVFTSTPGNHREGWTMIDDTIKLWSPWDMPTTFRNGIGDLILLVLYVWVVYSSLVYEGDMYPYPEAIYENEIDYFSRCYRFTLDANREQVLTMASTLCFPVSVPTGQEFNYAIDNPMDIEGGKEMSVQWRCVGTDYLDDIILKEFNEITAFYNNDMADVRREKNMVRLKADEYGLFNYWTYFRINPEDKYLERWVHRAKYNKVTSDLTQGIAGNMPAASTFSLPISYGGSRPQDPEAVAAANAGNQQPPVPTV